MPAWLHNDTTLPRLCAWAVVVLVVGGVGRMLWLSGVVAGVTDAEEHRIQLRWLDPAVHLEPLPTPATAPPPRAAGQAPVAASAPAHTLAPATARPPLQPPRPAPPAVAPSVPQVALYGPDGRPRLAQSAPALSGTAPADHLFEHRDALQTGLGQRATADLFTRERADTAQSKVQKAIYGRDIQHAKARRPPPVRFDPRLHERASELGSEATGDAYKAAPIAFEKAPDLAGGASRRVRASIGELERRYPACAPAQVRSWMAPALAHLDALERVEYRVAHGADPVEAEHTLPSAADSAYDLARRALWEAQQRMARCGAE